MTFGGKHPRRAHLFFAGIFYGFLAAAGIIWIQAMGRPTLEELFVVRDRPLAYGIGFGGGLAIAGASAVLVKWFAPARNLEREFGWLVGNQNVWEIGVLALASGVSEEIVFRGALRHAVGPWPTVGIFALAHPPFNSRLTYWPVFALTVGAVLELEFEATGGLVAPVITHVLVNFINLLKISVKYRALEE